MMQGSFRRRGQHQDETPFPCVWEVLRPVSQHVGTDFSVSIPSIELSQFTYAFWVMSSRLHKERVGISDLQNSLQLWHYKIFLAKIVRDLSNHFSSLYMGLLFSSAVSCLCLTKIGFFTTTKYMHSWRKNKTQVLQNYTLKISFWWGRGWVQATGTVSNLCKTLEPEH